MAQPDLSIYLLVHNGLRQEFGLLSKAAKSIRNDSHRALVNDQLEMVMNVLRLHHAEEDAWVFPTLVARLPECEPGISGLMTDHRALQHLLDEISTTSRSLEDRAHALADLHHLLGDHLDREERDVIPLVLATMNAGEWDQSAHRPLNGLSRVQMPIALGWLNSANDGVHMKAALNSMPLLVQALFRLKWVPAYEKRRSSLYI